ncbi:hypothetical protein HY837_02860 [archaeon]|nr:hypothetical protein [archaeon]
MKKEIILGILALILLISACTSNNRLTSISSNKCVDDCLKFSCKLFDEAGRSEGFSCATDYKVKDNFVQACKENCGVVEKKAVGCEYYRPKLILKSDLDKTPDEILTARNNYEVRLLSYKSEGRADCYNTNTQSITSSFWMMLKLNVTNNNNFSLNILTIKIAQFNGEENIGWGRLVIPVQEIKNKESKEIVMYYPGDLSSVSTVTKVEVTIEKDLGDLDKQNIKELH